MSAVLSILFGIISYSMLNIGLVLEKKGAALLPQIEGQSFIKNIKNFLTNKYWVIGFLLTCLQWIFYAIAVNLGTLSLVSPMMGVGFVVLVLFSYFYLKEPISKKELIAIGTVVIGVIILGATNPNQEVSYTISQMNILLIKPNAIFFNIILAILIIFPLVFSVLRHFYKADVIFGIISGILGGIGAIFTKATMTGIDLNNFFGSMGSSFLIWQFYVYILLFLGGNTASVMIQQVGYQKGKATTIATLFSVFALITPVIGGIIIFDDWANFSILIVILKLIGLAFIIGGVGILSFATTNINTVKRQITKKIGVNESKIMHSENKDQDSENSNIEDERNN